MERLGGDRRLLTDGFELHFGLDHEILQAPDAVHLDRHPVARLARGVSWPAYPVSSTSPGSSVISRARSAIW